MRSVSDPDIRQDPPPPEYLVAVLEAVRFGLSCPSTILKTPSNFLLVYSPLVTVLVCVNGRAFMGSPPLLMLAGVCVGRLQYLLDRRASSLLAPLARTSYLDRCNDFHDPRTFPPLLIFGA